MPSTASLDPSPGGRRTFPVPEAVQAAAKRALAKREKLGRGGTSVGLATARWLASGRPVTEAKLRHVARYFPRHAGDNLDDPESNGSIAWDLWGGDPGRRWSEAEVAKLDKAAG